MRCAGETMFRILYVLAKLLPCAVALRRDRKEWSRKEGDVDQEKYRRNARRALGAFLSLGPVYIKLGQWLSSRADILPQPYMEELSKLQDDVPAAPFEKVRPAIEAEFGPIGEAFERFETEALSGASLGQVYRARLRGEEIVVKVKRPGIGEAVERDLGGLRRLLPVGLRFVDPNLGLSAKALLEQFVDSIREEMDYRAEADNLRQIRGNMDASRVIVPRIYEAHTGRGLLVMEYVPGTKVTDIEKLDKLGIDRTRLVVDLHKVFFTMLLRHSVFHADPHPGNVSVTDDGRLILYDYGMVGRLDEESRMRLVRLYLAMVEKDAGRTVTAMKELGMLASDLNRSLIEQAIELTVSALHGRRPSEMEINGLMEIANRTMSRFPFVLPKHLALYMRMASIIEGIYKAHDVDFRFVKVIREVLEEENLIRGAQAEELKTSLYRVAKSIDAVISVAPELRSLVEEARSMRLERRRSRTPAAVMAGAAFVGFAVLYGHEPLFGAAGMAGAAIAALLALR